MAQRFRFKKSDSTDPKEVIQQEIIESGYVEYVSICFQWPALQELTDDDSSLSKMH